MITAGLIIDRVNQWLMWARLQKTHVVVGSVQGEVVYFLSYRWDHTPCLSRDYGIRGFDTPRESMGYLVQRFCADRNIQPIKKDHPHFDQTVNLLAAVIFTDEELAEWEAYSNRKHKPPEDNRDRDVCYWCGKPTVRKGLFTTTYYYCERCGK